MLSSNEHVGNGSLSGLGGQLVLNGRTSLAQGVELYCREVDPLGLERCLEFDAERTGGLGKDDDVALCDPSGDCGGDIFAWADDRCHFRLLARSAARGGECSKLKR